MTSKLRIWAGVGAFALVQAGPHLADTVHLKSSGTAWAQEGGEGGEGGQNEGGEGGEGGGVRLSYSLLTTDPDAFAYDAGPVLGHHVAHVHASYAAAAAGAKTLQQTVDALLAGPSADTLAAARKAWLEARPAYLVTEAFRFYDGPIEEIEGRINAWPLNEAFIDYVEGQPQAGLVNDTTRPLTLDVILASDQVSDEADVTTGWHAIEFLLWGQDLSADGPGNRPYTDYVAGSPANDRRREYLRLVTGQLVADLDSLAAAWDPAAGPYAAQFNALPPREALGRMVQGMATLAGFEFMSERLAVALDSGDQEDEHSCFSDSTKQDFVYDLKGIADVWSGEGAAGAGPGIGSLVAARDPQLKAEVDGLLADATAAVAALGDPWDRVLAAPPGSPERAAAERAVTSLEALGEGLKKAGNNLGLLVIIPTG